MTGLSRLVQSFSFHLLFVFSDIEHLLAFLRLALRKNLVLGEAD